MIVHTTDTVRDPATEAGAGLPARPGSPRRRSAAQRFFGVAVRGRTWTNLIYLVFAFPLGVFYFSFLVSALSTAIGTIIVWVGLPLFWLTAILWWAFAAIERYLADGLLGTNLAPAPQPWRGVVGIWPRLKAHLGAAATWKDLAFLFAKFPLGILSFVVVVVGVSVPAAFVSAPIAVHWSDWTSAPVPPDERGFYLTPWHIDTTLEALIFVPLGILLFFVALHCFNGVAALWRAAAGALLETDHRPRGMLATGAAAYSQTQPPEGWGPAHFPPYAGAPQQGPPFASPPRPPAAPPPAGPYQPPLSYLNVPGPPTPPASPPDTGGRAQPDATPSGTAPPDAAPPETPPPDTVESPPAKPRTPKPNIWEDDDA